MSAYDPADDGALYLFDMSGRDAAKNQLTDDIPRLVSEFGDAISVRELYENIYNHTPAHTDDIHAAMIANPDLQIITELGSERRKANTIGPSDILSIRNHTS